jgi:hypothetical protein
MLRRLLPVSALLCLAVVFSGCGFGGSSMSTAQVAAYFQRTFPMQDVSCTTTDTGGWQYACTFTDPQGTRLKIGADLHNGTPFGSGTVPANAPLPRHA